MIVVSTEELGDWLDCSRAFGAAQGIDLNPS